MVTYSKLLADAGVPHVLVIAAAPAPHNGTEEIEGDWKLKPRPRVLPFEIWKNFCHAFQLRASVTVLAPYTVLFQSRSGIQIFTQFDPRKDGRLGAVKIVVRETEGNPDNRGPIGRVRSALAVIANIPKVHTKRTYDQIAEDRSAVRQAIRTHEQRVAEQRRIADDHAKITENMRKMRGTKFDSFDDLGRLRK